MKIEKAAKQLEALGNPTRLKVYRALVRAGDDGLPVGRLQEKLGVAASTLSHHLHRLILTGSSAGTSGDDADLPRQLSGDEQPGRIPGRRMLRRRKVRRHGR